MYKCKVCGKEFELKLENHYVSRDNQPTGLAVLAGSKESSLYDTFDCPFCGCQNTVNQRKRMIYYEEEYEPYEEESKEETEEYEPYEEEEDCDEEEDCGFYDDREDCEVKCKKKKVKKHE